jgi:hypothetical protein
MYAASSASTFDLVFWSHHKYNNDLQPSNDADWRSYDHVKAAGWIRVGDLPSPETSLF